MKALLMHRDRDFDVYSPLPWNVEALTQDLGLDAVLQAMAGGDELVLTAARKALLPGSENDLQTILYRQAIVRDALENPEIVRGLYNFVGEVIQTSKKHSWGITSHYPSSMLYGATDLLEMFLTRLRQLRGIAEEKAQGFQSEGFTALFAMLKQELSEEFLATIHAHLNTAKLRKGLLLSAALGESNESTNLVQRTATGKNQSWWHRILGKGPPAYTFELHERDEAGARILGKIRDRGTSRVAVALAESAGHVLSFFAMLRTELAFYVGCINLRAQLASRGLPVSFPVPSPAGDRTLHFSEIYDVCLALHLEKGIVGNTASAEGKNLILVTGANQGGKSTFLRSIGQAQLMMQCGMFCGAGAFAASVCSGVFTHYKREEDAGMKSGKFDEEMARLSEIADHVAADAMLLFNESFAATNEREGSEIAKQIVCALLEKRVRIVYVTHLYAFAHALFAENRKDILFLRAERKADGARTFRLLEGEPLETSYGPDLYRQIFTV